MSLGKSAISSLRHLGKAQNVICAPLSRTIPTALSVTPTCALRGLCTSSSFKAQAQAKAAEPTIQATPSSSSSNENNAPGPSKETLLRIDWMLEHLAPGILKSRLKPFFDICKEDVVFEDTLYNYNLNQRSKLLSHIAKIRMYYRYLSPYNKVERIGSCVYEGEDVIILLWRLSTLESNMWSYFPSFLTKKEPKITTVEGALDVHITPEGQIYKLVNRKITAADREGARVMANVKEQQEAIRKKEEEKELRRQGEQIVEDQKRRGLM